MSTKTNSEKRKFKRLAAEQDRRHELFTKTIRQQNMFHLFVIGFCVGAFLSYAWFQICCKFSLSNPEEIVYFTMVSSLFCFLFGWITASDFDRKDILPNFAFIGGYFTFVLPYIFLQVNIQTSAEIVSTLVIACFVGGSFMLLFHWIKAAIRSLPKCFSHSQNV